MTTVQILCRQQQIQLAPVPVPSPAPPCSRHAFFFLLWNFSLLSPRLSSPLQVSSPLSSPLPPDFPPSRPHSLTYTLSSSFHLSLSVLMFYGFLSCFILFPLFLRWHPRIPLHQSPIQIFPSFPSLLNESSSSFLRRGSFLFSSFSLLSLFSPHICSPLNRVA